MGFVSYRAWGLVAVWVLAAAVGCAGSDPEAPGRVLVVGLDGASLRVIEPMLKAGRLPNLERLAREGVMGPLRSAMPMASPRIWNTIATGKGPWKHGVTDFAKPGPDGKPRLLLSSDRQTHAIWNILSERGFDVSIVNLWNTYPPEKVHGVMVSDHLLSREVEGRETFSGAAETPTGPLIHPEALAPLLMATLRDAEPLVDFANPFESDVAIAPNAPRKVMAKRFDEDLALARLTVEIDREIRPDFAMLLLPGIDRISHHLWAGMEPPEAYPPYMRMTDAQRLGSRAVVEAYYEFSDALLGKLFALYGPDDLVVVLSDHGFEAGVALISLTGIHEGQGALDGVFFARGPGIPAGGRLPKGSLRVVDITPTLLAWLGLPVARDMDGHVATFLDRPSVAAIDSYDGPPIERLAHDPENANTKRIEELRALGYLE